METGVLGTGAVVVQWQVLLVWWLHASNQGLTQPPLTLRWPKSKFQKLRQYILGHKISNHQAPKENENEVEASKGEDNAKEGGESKDGDAGVEDSRPPLPPHAPQIHKHQILSHL